MENASKALLMAGGMLIAILLLTLFTYLMRQTGESTANIYSTLSQSEISEFNQQFLNYEGRGINFVEDAYHNKIYDPLSVQEVVTLINLAKHNNKNNKLPTKIAIYLDVVAPGSNLVENNYIEMLNENIETPKQYNCERVNIDPNTMLVDYVLIKTH